MKKYKTTITLITGVTMSACTFSHLSEQEQKRIKNSSQFDIKTEKFINREPGALDMNVSYTEMLREYFGSSNERVPDHKMPEEKPDLEEFQKPSEGAKVIWLGHSSFLLRLSNKTILVDPVLSDYASPVSFLIARRFQAPVLKAEELPPVDLVLISHDHYDHLDKKTIQILKKTAARFIVPLGVGQHLKGWGIAAGRIQEADWWDEIQYEDIRFVCTPAQHFSGRGVFDRNSTLWASWAVLTENYRVFYSGDSGYSSHYKEIGEKLGPFDLTFIENGQYDRRWPGVHQTPEQAVQAILDLKGRAAVPVHWGMFELAMHPWYEPAERFLNEAAIKGIKAYTPVLGQLLNPGGTTEPVTDRWWKMTPAPGVIPEKQMQTTAIPGLPNPAP